MRWFKHFTDSLDDPFIQELMDEFSHAGYAAFFGLIEIIARENGRELTGDLEISPAYLKRKLRISQTKLKQIFGFCSTKGKLISDFSGEKWKFNFPKIAELKDNYTKDLQATNKKPSKQVEVEVEVEKEEERKDIKKKDFTQHEISFEEFWEAYPKRAGKKIGKAAAKVKFFKLKNSELADIITAVYNYADSKTAQDGYAKDPERFFVKDYWKEWIEAEVDSSGGGQGKGSWLSRVQ